jgi:hypothetical protein
VIAQVPQQGSRGPPPQRETVAQDGEDSSWVPVCLQHLPAELQTAQRLSQRQWLEGQRQQMHN